MNDLGMTLAWIAVQVTLVAVPALILHALASRRGPASGAWVATISLGLVLILSVSAWMVGADRGVSTPLDRAGPKPAATGDGAVLVTPPRIDAPEIGVGHSRPAIGRGWDLAGLWRAWARIERGAAEPAARCRTWGSPLAFVALTGTGIGLFRLIHGLLAVHVCRRRGKVVDDPGMVGLLDALRETMEFRRDVALREVYDLITPATAGVWWPVILLPDDWRSWNDSERRAVLAHELAHIIRGDYAAGLLARLAVVLNYYHPLVRRIAAKLLFQQELAADALAARFAGGPASYLVALSHLALKQDGRSPCWPAREFLPVRGTLIRRIEMLRDRNDAETPERPTSRAWRLLTCTALLALTAGVATLRGPARGAEDVTPAAVAVKSRTPAAPTVDVPFAPLYVREDMVGLVAVRPAAALRRKGMAKTLPPLLELLDEDFSDLARQLKVDTSRPGYLKLGCDDVESVICGIGIGIGRAKDSDGVPLHSIRSSGLTVRTVAPFDWLAFLRQWRLEFAEVRVGQRPYFRITGPLKEPLGPDPCVYLPDDRTIVFDEEKVIRTLIGPERPPLPTYLQGPDWERASRGLLAVAIENRGEKFAKCYDLGRPDDAVVLSLFRGVDHWTFGLDDADAISLHAASSCRNVDASEGTTRAIRALLALAHEGLNKDTAASPPLTANQKGILRVARALLANVRIMHTDHSVELRTEGFGTLGEFTSMLLTEANRVNSQGQKTAARPEGSRP